MVSAKMLVSVFMAALCVQYASAVAQTAMNAVNAMYGGQGPICGAMLYEATQASVNAWTSNTAAKEAVFTTTQGNDLTGTSPLFQPLGNTAQALGYDTTVVNSLRNIYIREDLDYHLELLITGWKTASTTIGCNNDLQAEMGATTAGPFTGGNTAKQFVDAFWDGTNAGGSSPAGHGMVCYLDVSTVTTGVTTGVVSGTPAWAATGSPFIAAAGGVKTLFYPSKAAGSWKSKSTNNNQVIVKNTLTAGSEYHVWCANDAASNGYTFYKQEAIKIFVLPSNVKDNLKSTSPTPGDTTKITLSPTSIQAALSGSTENYVRFTFTDLWTNGVFPPTLTATGATNTYATYCTRAADYLLKSGLTDKNIAACQEARAIVYKDDSDPAVTNKYFAWINTAASKLVKTAAENTLGITICMSATCVEVKSKIAVTNAPSNTEITSFTGASATTTAYCTQNQDCTVEFFKTVGTSPTSVALKDRIQFKGTGAIAGITSAIWDVTVAGKLTVPAAQLSIVGSWKVFYASDTWLGHSQKNNKIFLEQTGLTVIVQAPVAADAIAKVTPNPTPVKIDTKSTMTVEAKATPASPVGGATIANGDKVWLGTNAKTNPCSNGPTTTTTTESGTLAALAFDLTAKRGGIAMQTAFTTTKAGLPLCAQKANGQEKVAQSVGAVAIDAVTDIKLYSDLDLTTAITCDKAFAAQSATYSCASFQGYNVYVRVKGTGTVKTDAVGVYAMDANDKKGGDTGGLLGLNALGGYVHTDDVATMVGNALNVTNIPNDATFKITVQDGVTDYVFTVTRKALPAGTAVSKQGTIDLTSKTDSTEKYCAQQAAKPTGGAVALKKAFCAVNGLDTTACGKLTFNAACTDLMDTAKTAPTQARRRLLATYTRGRYTFNAVGVGVDAQMKKFAEEVTKGVGTATTGPLVTLNSETGSTVDAVGGPIVGGSNLAAGSATTLTAIAPPPPAPATTTTAASSSDDTSKDMWLWLGPLLTALVLILVFVAIYCVCMAQAPVAAKPVETAPAAPVEVAAAAPETTVESTSTTEESSSESAESEETDSEETEDESEDEDDDEE